MVEKAKQILRNLEKNAIVLPDIEFDAIVKGFDFNFPESYLSIMRIFNGGEGEVGSESWLLLFPIDELQGVNEDYDFLMSEIPDYFLFGKDAADTGYAFHKKNGTFHSFGLMSNFETDPIDFHGNNFLEFLEYLDSFKFDD